MFNVVKSVFQYQLALLTSWLLSLQKLKSALFTGFMRSYVPILMRCLSLSTKGVAQRNKYLEYVWRTKRQKSTCL
jgi:hypothetical protein